MDKEVAQALGKHKQFFKVEQHTNEDGSTKTRITCILNDMSFPPRADAIQAFVKGKKFEALLRYHAAEQSISQFEPFIMASKNFPTMLYCSLTGQLMEKSVEAAKKHQAGKRYINRKELYESGLVKIKPEPDLDEVLAEASGRKKPNKKKEPGSDGEEEGEEEGEGEEEVEDEEEEDRPLNKRAKSDKEKEVDMDEDVEEDIEEEEEEDEHKMEEGSSDDFEFEEPTAQGPPAKVPPSKAKSQSTSKVIQNPVAEKSEKLRASSESNCKSLAISISHKQKNKKSKT